jgi:hypothetical protein
MLGFFNPIFVKSHPTTIVDLSPLAHAGLLAFALTLELVFIFVWVSWRERVKPLRLICSLIGMHAITYPVTLYLSRLIGLNAEIFPFAFEIWLFPQLVARPARSTLTPVVLGNALSFSVGLVLPSLYLHLFLPALSR